jgi:hypothetical protein
VAVGVASGRARNAVRARRRGHGAGSWRNVECVREQVNVAWRGASTRYESLMGASKDMCIAPGMVIGLWVVGKAQMAMCERERVHSCSARAYKTAPPCMMFSFHIES